MYHSKITQQFGKDLTGLLGPKANRVPWHTLDATERRKRLNKIPVYINTRSLGKHPKLVEIVFFCLSKLANMGMDNPLLGVDLMLPNSEMYSLDTYSKILFSDSILDWCFRVSDV